jgi:hypothetical protein
MSENTRVKTILLLAANPRQTSQLRLDEEVREIDEGLRRANKREQFKLEQKWAVRWHGVPAFGDRATFTEQSWTLSLDFTDDFFAAIRYLYVARASDSEFHRLSFVLIGVATPGDLIRDPKRTPFNIGQRVDLTDFTFEEAKPLGEGLGLTTNEVQQVLRWMLEWTGGHPYLSQRLCCIVSQENKKSWSKSDVDPRSRSNSKFTHSKYALRARCANKKRKRMQAPNFGHGKCKKIFSERRVPQGKRRPLLIAPNFGYGVFNFEFIMREF